MATRGVFQLQKLILTYSEVGGSSKAVRNYIGSGKLAAWAAAHPHVEVHVQVKNGRHPNLEGKYKTHAASHQICVRNLDSAREVQQVCDMLHNRSGRKITKITTPVLTDTPTIQGVWTPFLDLHQQPPFQVKIE